jgi:hypothetical protein
MDEARVGLQVGTDSAIAELTALLGEVDCRGYPPSRVFICKSCDDEDSDSKDDGWTFYADLPQLVTSSESDDDEDSDSEDDGRTFSEDLPQLVTSSESDDDEDSAHRAALFR